MDHKSYLAMLLVLIFVGKLAIFDAKFPALIFEASEITLVNNWCPKKQMQISSPEEYTSENYTSFLEIDFLCHSAYNIQLGVPSNVLAGENYKKYTYNSPGIFSIPHKKYYPPPKA
ncbi:hypothetical protein [Salinimicrobium oceani]|uniref:Uncharacterized protein n=1 Tax=Salinimicrobium oceani TaxID=2722702 RepID=A0ABX1CUU3_9FLAO|nr:hypothetical protein [Salinimicrobium oceani]NJW51517.1 hypothetical protein [Salinimicrobium oceani]